MGIKNLKSLLIAKRLLRRIEYPVRSDLVFVDFMGVYISIAYSVSSTRMLRRTVMDRIENLRRSFGTVALFLDQGSITIKSVLRKKRKESAAAQLGRKREETERLRAQLEALSPEDLLFEERREHLRARIDKNAFYLYLCENRNIYSLLEEIVAALPEAVSVTYCSCIDAEFEMCYQARRHYTDAGYWPVIYSNDQDTLCLSCVDTAPKVICDAVSSYLLVPDLGCHYLVRLTILVNGCDFFRGLFGISIHHGNAHLYATFDEFSLTNIVRSLAYRSYRFVRCKEVELQPVIDFIDAYAGLDKGAYEIEGVTDLSLSAEDFMFSVLYPRWCRFRDEHALGNSLLSNLYTILTARAPVSEDKLALAEGMMHYYSDNDNLTEAAVRVFVAMLGFSLENRVGLLAVNSDLEIMIPFDENGTGDFYFNDKKLIENVDGLINISL
ncbi:FEN1-like nuclease [Eastern grey kangaroopox virus]|uniref:FEN1-like nuclease n=1 Tax=Eastern grey kangaroopox virus TaxID=2042482 RepID=A0A2C9DT29_9POXV|nr:FEN1-like nuclease [Eastern grey kangaroopox virus]ATI21162.1 FEN1-like nuclease [Eastern grey kangaroopox virus]AXK50172.1 FEN1-like nuclease [Eastern grey kangaroopox virus]